MGPTRRDEMIPIAALQGTAEALMAKAAIEIPDDYLDGLRRAADTEKGELSAFVIQARLGNYRADKEDRRAMCGHTDAPRRDATRGNTAQLAARTPPLQVWLREATS